MKLTCVIVDDEPLARDLLLDNIRKIPFLEFKAEFNSAISAKEYLSKNKIDLIFLDIQMPQMSGVDLAKAIQNTMVVFTTAFDQYALEGFEVSAIDYILKPIMFDRFEKACIKAKEYHDYQHKRSKSSDHIFIRADHQTLKISVEDILYIEGLKDYVKVFTKKNPKPFLTRTNLKGMSEQLSTEQFIRIHKSYIVNYKLIDALQTDSLTIGSIKLPVGDAYKTALKENFK